MPSLTEADVQRTVIDALRVHGWRFVHFRPAQNRSGRWLTPFEGDDGFPDLLAVKSGRQLALECKSTRGVKKPKPTARGSELLRLIRYEQQEAWLDEFRPMSELAQFVGPNDLDDVLKVIAGKVTLTEEGG